jgi:16S rRNA (uracil1498-N3)-methyltransferase
MRQFVSDEMPDAQGRIRVDGKDWHYLRNVLRLRDGDTLDVADKSGGEVYPMRLQVEGSQKSALLVPITNSGESTRPLRFLEKYRFVLFQFLPKAPKFDLILRQAVELGVSAVVPIRGEFSPPLSEGRRERWQKIVREARQQSGSPVPTEVLPVMTVEEAVRQRQKEGGTGYMLSEFAEGDESVTICGSEVEATRATVVATSLPTQTSSVSIAVGCEGGISPAERACLRDAGFRLLHFPINVMRVETAALYGMAAIQTSLMALPIRAAI